MVHFSVSFHGAGALDGVARRRHRELRPRAEAVAGTSPGGFFKRRSAGGSSARYFTLDCHARLWTVTRANHAGFWQEALANLQNTIDEKVEESGLPDNLAALRDRALNTVDAARVTCRREIETFKREQEEHFSRLDAEAAAAAADAADAAALNDERRRNRGIAAVARGGRAAGGGAEEAQQLEVRWCKATRSRM